MTVSNNKVIEVGKSKKHTFSSKDDFVHLLWKVNFLTAPEQSCRRCGQFDIGVTICVDLQHLLISLARGLKYFYNVELLYPFDEFQTNEQIVYSIKNTQNKKNRF